MGGGVNINSLTGGEGRGGGVSVENPTVTQPATQPPTIPTPRLRTLSLPNLKIAASSNILSDNILQIEARRNEIIRLRAKQVGVVAI